MTSACHWLQLGTGNGGKFEGATAPPHDNAPHVLKFERFVHGEVRLSIYPQPVAWQPRRTLTAVRGSCHPGNYAPQRAVTERRIARQVQGGLLDRSSEFQEGAKEISGWGRLPRKKIFRAYARRKIQEAGEILWRKFGRNGIFLTGTVPGSGSAIAKTVAEYSGWLMNRINQWFRDGFSMPYGTIAVWELQKRGMLHIHVCVCSADSATLARFLSQWKERWNSLLLELSRKAGIDLFQKNKNWTWADKLEKTQHDADFLKKNPARYLAKYLTKAARAAVREYEFHPSRWWSVDRKTAAQAVAERVRLLLGGMPLHELNTAAAAWFERSSECFEQIFSFGNPEYPKCGGVAAFTDSTHSLNLAAWFEFFLCTTLQLEVQNNA
ncbi:MAG: hypothetical protein K2X27_04245 [Candidatus Obscuribacterales bacterium]|nr:hypothetical protein [Candidatus Obscuribacterales bacterium]